MVSHDHCQWKRAHFAGGHLPYDARYRRAECLLSNRGTDHHDPESPEVIAALDWDKLEQLATDDNETKASALNERNYSDFKANYNENVRRFWPCGN